MTVDVDGLYNAYAPAVLQPDAACGRAVRPSFRQSRTNVLLGLL